MFHSMPVLGRHGGRTLGGTRECQKWSLPRDAREIKILFQNGSMSPRPVKISRNARAGGPCYEVNDGFWDRH